MNPFIIIRPGTLIMKSGEICSLSLSPSLLHRHRYGYVDNLKLRYLCDKSNFKPNLTPDSIKGSISWTYYSYLLYVVIGFSLNLKLKFLPQNKQCDMLGKIFSITEYLDHVFVVASDRYIMKWMFFCFLAS